MNFNDNSSALYVDPNAYIQSRPKCDHCEPKKVVFSEPYETMPNYYIDNGFKKGNCDCIPKNHNNPHSKPFCNCDNNCNNESNHCNNNFKDCDNNFNNNGNNKQPQYNSGFHFNFDFKNLLPLLGAFGKSGGGFGEILSKLNPTSNSAESGGGFNMGNIGSLLSSLAGSGGLNSILNLFKGKKTQPKITEKSTDFCIKDYQRIE